MLYFVLLQPRPSCVKFNLDDFGNVYELVVNKVSSNVGLMGMINDVITRTSEVDVTIVPPSRCQETLTCKLECITYPLQKL